MYYENDDGKKMYFQLPRAKMSFNNKSSEPNWFYRNWGWLFFAVVLLITVGVGLYLAK